MRTKVQKYRIHGVEFNVVPGASRRMHQFQDGIRGMYREHDEMLDFIQRTKNLRHLVDVGAEYGAFSLVFTRHQDATALAIEPSPRAYPMLKMLADVNPERHVETMQVFIGENRGASMSCAYLGQQLHADQGGGPEWHQKWGGCAMEDARLMLPQVPLDDICKGRTVDCIKIDTEGFECSVLRSARETISKWRPVLFLEIHAGCFPGHGDSIERFMQIVNQHGYELLHHDGSPAHPLQDNSFMRVVAMPRLG